MIQFRARAGTPEPSGNRAGRSLDLRSLLLPDVENPDAATIRSYVVAT